MSTEFVYEKENDQVGPLLVSFRSGRPESVEDGMSLQLFEKDGSKGSKRMVLAADDTLIFQGTNYGSNKESNNLSNYAVGVYDPSTDQIEVCNIPHVYILNQTIQDYQANVDENVSTGTSNFDQRQALALTFGSKMGRKIVKQHTDGQIHLDSVSGANAITKALKRKIQETQDEATAKLGSSVTSMQSRLDAAALDASRSMALPPYDLNAKNVSEVYKPERFLQAEQLEVLDTKAREFIKIVQESSIQNFISTYGLDGFVAKTLERLSPDHLHKQVRKIGYIFYFGYLLSLLGTRFPVRGANLVRLSETIDIPYALMDHLLGLFSNSVAKSTGVVTYSQPKELKDKLLLYTCTMALIVREFSVDLEEFGLSIKRSTAFVRKYFLQLGCRIDSSTQKAIGIKPQGRKNASSSQRAVLTVPLKFPTLNQSKRSR